MWPERPPKLPGVCLHSTSEIVPGDVAARRARFFVARPERRSRSSTNAERASFIFTADRTLCYKRCTFVQLKRYSRAVEENKPCQIATAISTHFPRNSR